MRRKRPANWSAPSRPPDLALCGNLYCNRFSIYRPEGGWREGPVHLEGHRLVHDRLVGRVSRERGAPTAVLRRRSRGLPRRVGRTSSCCRPLQTPRRPHRPRRQGGRATASSARSTAGAGEPNGTNRYIPYQPDRPNRALTLRVFPVLEQYGCVFVWHQPEGKEPQWEMPDIFKSFPQFETDPDAYYRPYPEFSRLTENEPVHPQIVAENGPDSAHFQYVHRASVTPGCSNGASSTRSGVSSPAGPTPQRRSRQDGLAYPQPHVRPRRRDQRVRRIVKPSPDLCVHAVEDENSNMFYSIWWPKIDGETSDVPPTRSARRWRNSTWAPCGKTWTSGGTRSTSSARRCRGWTRNRIWRCASGPRSSTRCPRRCENRPRRDRGTGTHRDRHPGMSGRGRRPTAGLAVLDRDGTLRGGRYGGCRPSP